MNALKVLQLGTIICKHIAGDPELVMKIVRTTVFVMGKLSGAPDEDGLQSRDMQETQLFTDVWNEFDTHVNITR